MFFPLRLGEGLNWHGVFGTGFFWSALLLMSQMYRDRACIPPVFLRQAVPLLGSMYKWVPYTLSLPTYILHHGGWLHPHIGWFSCSAYLPFFLLKSGLLNSKYVRSVWTDVFWCFLMQPVWTPVFSVSFVTPWYFFMDQGAAPQLGREGLGSQRSCSAWSGEMVQEGRARKGEVPWGFS